MIFNLVTVLKINIFMMEFVIYIRIHDEIIFY